MTYPQTAPVRWHIFKSYLLIYKHRFKYYCNKFSTFHKILSRLHHGLSLVYAAILLYVTWYTCGHHSMMPLQQMVAKIQSDLVKKVNFPTKIINKNN